MFLGILRRFIGVTDIATVRFSLPSQLLEPVPNLGALASPLQQRRACVAAIPGVATYPCFRILELSRPSRDVCEVC